MRLSLCACWRIVISWREPWFNFSNRGGREVGLCGGGAREEFWRAQMSSEVS